MHVKEKLAAVWSYFVTKPPLFIPWTFVLSWTFGRFLATLDCQVSIIPYIQNPPSSHIFSFIEACVADNLFFWPFMFPVVNCFIFPIRWIDQSLNLLWNPTIVLQKDFWSLLYGGLAKFTTSSEVAQLLFSKTHSRHSSKFSFVVENTISWK